MVSLNDLSVAREVSPPHRTNALQTSAFRPWLTNCGNQIQKNLSLKLLVQIKLKGIIGVEIPPPNLWCGIRVYVTHIQSKSICRMDDVCHVTHMNESWDACESCHIWMSYGIMSHGIHMNESRRLYESWHTYIYMCALTQLIRGISQGTHIWVMAHVCTSHGTHMNELRQTWTRQGMPHAQESSYIWMSHVCRNPFISNMILMHHMADSYMNKARPHSKWPV